MSKRSIASVSSTDSLITKPSTSNKKSKTEFSNIQELFSDQDFQISDDFCRVCRVKIIKTRKCNNPVSNHLQSRKHKDIQAQMMLAIFLRENNIPKRIGRSL